MIDQKPMSEYDCRRFRGLSSVMQVLGWSLSLPYSHYTRVNRLNSLGPLGPRSHNLVLQHAGTLPHPCLLSNASPATC